MKLTELDPRWISEPTGPIGFGFVPSHPLQSRTGQGVTFNCPVHGSPCRLAVLFENPIDGMPRAFNGERFWTRTGDSFETLSLSPSVDVVGHWHGNVTSGEVSP